MRTQPDRTGNLDIALDARAKGIAAIPCYEGSKIPTVKWKPFQTELPSEEMLQEWFLGTRNNIAIVTSGMVLFDCDDATKAELVLEHCGYTPHRVRSPRQGFHFGYRKRQGVEVKNTVKIKGMDIDIRTDGGIEVIPNSVTADGNYEWLGELVPVAQLPVARIGWTREKAKRRVAYTLDIGADADRQVRRASAYLATVEGAVSGQRGHNKTYRVACLLTQRFGLSFAQAWPLFKEWNEQCEPPWSDRELEHKLQDALKQRK